MGGTLEGGTKDPRVLQHHLRQPQACNRTPIAARLVKTAQLFV